MAAAGLSDVALARMTAEAALGVPDVLGLHGGAVGEIATYGEGARVRGIRVHRRPDPRIRLHLIVRYGCRIGEVAEEVRASLRKALETDAPEFSRGVIDVYVADVRADHDAPPVGPPEEPVRWS